MSSRIFQGVIVQMKDATTRCIGVVDEQGFVIACSELSMIGSRLDDFQAAVGEVQCHQAGCLRPFRRDLGIFGQCPGASDQNGPGCEAR